MENPIKMDDLGVFPYFWKHPFNTTGKKIPCRKLTASLHLKMDGWNTFCFLGVYGLFSGAMLVSGSATSKEKLGKASDMMKEKDEFEVGDDV